MTTKSSAKKASTERKTVELVKKNGTVKTTKAAQPEQKGNGSKKSVGVLEEKIQIVKKLTQRKDGCTRHDAIEELRKKFPDNSITYLRAIVYNQCRALEFLKSEGGLMIKPKSILHFSVKVDPSRYVELQDNILSKLKGFDGVQEAKVVQPWSSIKREKVASGVFRRRDSNHYSAESRADLVDYLVEDLKLDEEAADKAVKQRGKVFVYAE